MANVAIANTLRGTDVGASIFPSPSFSTTTTLGHILVGCELLDALSGAQRLWRCSGDAWTR
eukprot:5645031-Ditylum_brightwellii.AAC.1